MSSSVISRYASKDSFLEDLEIRDVIAAACAAKDYHKKRVLMIVPDGTRTCPLGPVFKGVFEEIGAVAAAFDVMIALGTHQPMTEESICDRLEITVEERRTTYRDVRLLNHEWDNPTALLHIGTITSEEIERLTNALFSMEVPVTVNRHIYDYDQIIIAGPVFPHEVVGFSGGNKYLFPGVSGPESIELFPLVGSAGDEPDDYRQQVYSCESGGGPRGGHGHRSETLLLHGRRTIAAGWDLCRVAGARLEFRERPIQRIAYSLSGPSFRHRPVLRSRDVR